MNSEVTLTNHLAAGMTKGQVRLLYKRSDPHNAVLNENSIPRYVLTTSDDGVRKVKIRDAAQRMIVEVHRKTFLPDFTILASRNGGKAMKVEDFLKKGPITSEGQFSMTLHTEEGVYHWRRRQGHNWALYADSSYTPVAWTETVQGMAPTWELVLENRISSILDYVLASLFYVKGEPDTAGGAELEGINAQTAWLSMK